MWIIAIRKCRKLNHCPIEFFFIASSRRNKIKFFFYLFEFLSIHPKMRTRKMRRSGRRSKLWHPMKGSLFSSRPTSNVLNGNNFFFFESFIIIAWPNITNLIFLKNEIPSIDSIRLFVFDWIRFGFAAFRSSISLSLFFFAS